MDINKTLTDMKISVFKDLYKSKDVPYSMELNTVLDRIRVGKSKELIDRIRNGEKDYKNSLPCILFAGEFTERNSNSLVAHSGLMVVDFDKYPDLETMDKQMELLKANPYFISLFISPSGKGIKGVVRIPNATKETHPKYFKAFQKKFNYDYFDISNSNIDRVCFESYDPNIYINMEAEIFDVPLIDEGYSISERVPLIPISDEGKIIEKIMRFDWKKDFVEGERNSFIFDLAGAFCEYGISEYTAEGYILTNVIDGDFSESEAKTTIKSAYRKRSFDSKFFEDYNKIDLIKSDLKKGKKFVVDKYAVAEDIIEELANETEHDAFWVIDDKGKVSINPFRYKNFLERNGFKKYFPFESTEPTLVYVNENKVVETSVERIKDFVLDYLVKHEEMEVWNYCAKFNNLFSEPYLLMLPTIELMMLKDTREKSFIAFKNGVLEVTKNSVELVEYFTVGGYIWENQIINRNFEILDEFSNEYETFIKNVSNEEPLSLETVIGYLLSTYKNKMNNKAIILNDETITDNPEGGTGKGLFVQGLGQIRKIAVLDGKTFDDKKSFPYQTVSTETQILVFDDVIRNFNFENKFSLVTEGMTLERKNKDAIKLNVEESPKMVISTNYAIKGEGNSHDRRRFEVEIAQYYGKKLTPFDEFGRQLFDDWDEAEFLKFDNYMVKCLQSFLKEGLVPQNAKNIKMRKFIAETSMEFLEWIEDSQNIGRNVRLEKKLYYDKFVEDYQDFKKWLTRKKFNIWVQKYCSFKEHSYQEASSNGHAWFMIKTEEDANEIDF